MRTPYFDAHCDTISALFDEGGNLLENAYHLDLARLKACAPAAQFFAVWGGHFPEKAALLRAELLKYSELAVFCRSPKEVRKAAESGRVAALLSIEGAEQIDCSVEALRAAHEVDGVIMVNLCWNNDNALCGSALDGGGGLTEAGHAFLRAAQAMGVVIDMSHASERTFWDVMAVTERPIVASHSNAKTLCGHARNLTDGQFLALARAGGGAGLNLCPHFLGENPDVDTCVHTSSISCRSAGKCRFS
jgi:membrane dipeptidase